jgi:hypothetical protein
MPNPGSLGFRLFAENFNRVRAMETELAQETAVRREEFRASLIEEPLPPTSNLSAAYTLYRGRMPG